MDIRHEWVMAAALAIGMPLVHASPDRHAESGSDATRIEDEPYGGAVIDQTITVIGHHFFQQFVPLWRDKETSERYAISIHERPSARHGNLVWIEYVHRRIFQAYLPASRANIQSISREAADISYRNIVDTEVRRLLFREQDLGPDEI